MDMKQIIVTHKNADFDALASLVAATLIYADSVPILPKQVNPNVKAFLSIHKDLFNFASPPIKREEKISRLIVVDTNYWDRLEDYQILKNMKNMEILVWDHHPGEGDIHASWKCHETVGATISLLVRHLKREAIGITPIQATLFLLGLYEDTGNLSFESCKPDDAYAAAYLLEKGADLNVVNKMLRPAYGEKQRNVLFKLLDSIQRTKLNGHVIGIGEIQVEGHIDGLALVVRMLLDIVNVDAVFGIFSTKKRTMVIGRSQADTLDVGRLMRRLGGGGHPGAGSALLKSVEPQSVVELIKQLIKGNHQTSVQISDLMSFPVVTVSSDTPMDEVARKLRNTGCSGLPVLQDDRLVGMISRRDFSKLKKKSQLNAPVKAYMSTKVVGIEPGRSPLHAARLMIRHDIGRLPVVEAGRIIGIVTRSDTMRYYYDLLPE